jgi:hypothetical protein
MQLRQRDFRRAWALSIAEGLKLVRAAGIELVDPLPMPLALMPQIMRLPDALYRYVMMSASGGRVRVDPHARSSMADDLERGRATEVDYLQGEVVRLAERLGRKAPVNARLVELVKAAERGRSPGGRRRCIGSWWGCGNWTVAGNVDVVGMPNGFGITCDGNCVDLDGTRGPGGITSTSIAFVAGREVVISYDLSGQPAEQQ